MPKHSVAKFFLLLILACQGKAPTSETRDSNVDAPNVSQLTRLFEAIIGRQHNNNDAKLLTNLLKHDDDTLEKRTTTYKNQVDKILNSEQFIDEGFFHFHQQRMLLLKRQDAATIEVISERDYDSLRLELKDLAENSQDYWDILRYRRRYLALGVGGGIIGFPCDRSTSGLCKPPTVELMKSMIVDIIQNIGISYPYRDRCCTGSEGSYTTKTQLEKQYEAFCSEAGERANEVFDKDFCSLANDTFFGEKSNKVNKENIKWDKLSAAINFYLSLYLGVRSDEWLDVDVDIDDSDQPKLPTVEFNDTNYLIVNFPEQLQGIHANPFWLWTHKTSVANQHLRRARVVYHSWFCKRISPDQAQEGGGLPP